MSEELDRIKAWTSRELQESRAAGASWDELRKLIDTLEENENEARAERFYGDTAATTLDEVCEKAKTLK